MTDAPAAKHTPAEAQAKLGARLAAVINHLVAQQANAAPVTPAVIAELRDIAADIATCAEVLNLIDAALSDAGYPDSPYRRPQQ